MNGNQDLIKSVNQNKIINVLRNAQPMSIREIAIACGLSVPSTSVNVSILTEKGILYESGIDDTDVGRKPRLIAFNSIFRYIVAMDLGKEKVKIWLSNLDGDIVDELNMDLADKNTGEIVVKKLMQSLEILLKSNKLKKSDVSVIVIGNPGIVVDDTGRLARPAMPVLWAQLPIRTIIEDNMGIKTLVINDIKLAAMGEMQFGMGRDCKNFIYIRNAIGLAAGIVVDGQLIKGKSLASGEIGAMMMNYKSYNDFPDAVDTIETIEEGLCIPSFLSRILQRSKLVGQGCFYKNAVVNGEIPTVELVRKSIDNGDVIAIEETKKLGTNLGLVIYNLNAIMDTEKIIFGGDIIRLGDVFLEQMHKTVKKLTAFPPDIVFSSLENSSLYGAIVLATEVSDEQLLPMVDI